MRRRKNLERAVILGLLLSTSVYGSAFAAPPDPINDRTNDLLDSYDTSVTFSGDETTSAIDITNKDISIVTTNPNDGTITLESGEYGIKLNGNANITLDSASDNIINVSLNKDDGGSDHSDGVVIGNGTISLIADNANKITAGKLGLSVAGTNSQIYLEGKTNEIFIKYDKFINSDNIMYALKVDKDANATLKATDDIDINIESVSTKAYAIYLNNNSTANLTSYNGNVDITIKTGAQNPSGGYIGAIWTDNNSVIDVKAGKNIIITTSSNIEEQNNGSLDASAVRGNMGGQVNLNADGFLVIDTQDVNSNNDGIRANGDNAQVKLTTKGKNEDGAGIIINSVGKDSYASMAQDGSISLSAQGDIILSSSSRQYSRSIYNSAVTTSATTSINANGNDVQVSAYTDTVDATSHGIFNNVSANFDSKTELLGNKINILSTSDNTNAYGVQAQSTSTGNSKVSIIGNDVAITTYAGKTDYGILSTNSDVDIDAKNTVSIKSNTYGLYAWNAGYSNKAAVNIKSTNENYVTAKYAVVSSGENSVTSITSIENNNIIDSNINNGRGAWATNKGKVYLTANDGLNQITSNRYGIYSESNSDVDLIANNNALYAGEILTDQETQLQYGQTYAVNALSGSTVTLDAGNANDVYGAVYANGTGKDAENKDVPTTVTLDSANNIVKSYAVISGAGDIDTTNKVDGTTQTDNKFYNKKFVSALYAEEGANINLTGENYIGTYADNTDKNTLERTVWAYDEGTINITGASHIGTDRYSLSPNSADVAVAAGTATGLTYKMVDEFNGTRAEVNVKYDDFSNENTSSISGDILSAYAGLVNIDSDNENTGIKIEGNLLAGNNGILNVDIGKGGILTGRADDYGDAGVVNNFEADETNEHQEFYNPAFSSTIYKGGRVDLGMGAGSKWYVTGQSWITTIDTSEAKGDTPEERATIDLVTEYKDKDGGDIAAHALTVYDFKGDADFLMNLSGNRADTDMLYMKHADGNYRIMLDEDITSTDINQDKEGNEYSGLRFATVGADSKVTFDVGSYDNGGAFNVEYEVGQDEYGGAETAHENEAYNGTELNGGKPGDNMVDNFFGSEGEPVTDESANEGGISTASANGIMLMNEEVETFADEENNANKYNAINHKIIAIKDTEINDTGETILNMSRANYSNAIYMDRLNKRLGEARYINDDPEEDEGMWVRIRHDRIGKDDAYRSQNTMYELGYDKKQDCDNGERRVGFAVDYMHGDTGYSDIAGKGEIDRYGLWLYDTWMGDKGHYVDYVAKWGHLNNDFEVYTMRDSSQKVTGDYSNNVFSVSAEYGRKKDIGNDWYFEPQAQLQLARVTGADYTTNQGTKVSVDGINSLIGRAGFRIGKDFGEEKQSTLYFKADVLHEFLGDQDVYVMDKSTDNKWAGISYDNEGTWYDIGIGYAAMMSKSSYAFIDLEQSFGNDNDDTYQINAGVRWTF